MKAFHIVKRGDSFAGIAKQELGDQRRFQELQKRNPKISILELGDSVRLRDLCTCGRNIPEDAVVGQSCLCGERWTDE